MRADEQREKLEHALFIVGGLTCECAPRAALELGRCDRCVLMDLLRELLASNTGSEPK